MSKQQLLAASVALLATSAVPSAQAAEGAVAASSVDTAIDTTVNLVKVRNIRLSQHNYWIWGVDHSSLYLPHSDLGGSHPDPCLLRGLYPPSPPCPRQAAGEFIKTGVEVIGAGVEVAKEV